MKEMSEEDIFNHKYKEMEDKKWAEIKEKTEKFRNEEAKDLGIKLTSFGDDDMGAHLFNGLMNTSGGDGDFFTDNYDEF